MVFSVGQDRVTGPVACEGFLMESLISANESFHWLST